MNVSFVRLHRWDLAACVAVIRAHRFACCRHFFSIISRLGNGVFWYTMMAILPLQYGMGDCRLSAQLAINGALCTVIYKTLKRLTKRARPCHADERMLRSVPPLDRFSFPSGHTLHAVAFTLLIVQHHPAWSWVLIPFTVLVAMSRLVLGLHYPSDVLIGAAIGAGVTIASSAWWS